MYGSSGLLHTQLDSHWANSCHITIIFKFVSWCNSLKSLSVRSRLCLHENEAKRREKTTTACGEPKAVSIHYWLMNESYVRHVYCSVWWFFFWLQAPRTTTEDRSSSVMQSASPELVSTSTRSPSCSCTTHRYLRKSRKVHQPSLSSFSGRFFDLFCRFRFLPRYQSKFQIYRRLRRPTSCPNKSCSFHNFGPKHFPTRERHFCCNKNFLPPTMFWFFPCFCSYIVRRDIA